MNNRIVETLTRAIRKAGIEIHMLAPEQAGQLALQLSSDKDRPLFRQVLPVSSGIFHSNAMMVLQSIRQDKATPAQWLAMLTKNGGIKAGEDKWTGLSEWLMNHSGKSLDKSLISDYIQSHHIVLHEEHYLLHERSERFRKLQGEMDRYISEAKEQGMKYPSEWSSDAFECMLNDYGDDFDLAFGHDDGKLYIVNGDYAADFIHENLIYESRLRNTTPNLDDYREIAFHTTGIESWNEDDAIHFGEVGQGRCIAWIRFGEKTVERAPTIDEKWQRMKDFPGPEGWVREDVPAINAVRWLPGDWAAQSDKALISFSEDSYWLHNYATDQRTVHQSLDEAVDEYINQQVSKKISYKVLVIDEIQSNRHQEGRENGYRDEAAFKADEEEFFRANEAYIKFREQMTDKYGHDGRGAMKTGCLSEDEKAENDRLRDEFNLSMSRLNKHEDMPPPAPFEKNWHELCMKRMLRYAAENGYDKMVWTTGEQQGRRYNLGHSIQGIFSTPVHKEEDRTVRTKEDVGSYSIQIETRMGNIDIVTSKDGKVIQSSEKEYYDHHLNQLVGKSIASKILSSLKCQHFTGYEADFRIGIEGMRAFYDKILPSFLNKYGKQWGITVQEMKLPNLGTMHGIDITPEVQRLAQQSQPMFMLGGKGQLVGFTQGNHIYLTPEGLMPETLVHEYTHVWAQAMRYGNPEGWQSIKDLLRESPVRGELLAQPAYKDLISNEDLMTMEVLAHLSGRANASRLADYEQRYPSVWMQKITQALHRFWSWVGQHMFDIKRFNDVNEITDRILYDLLKSSRITDVQVFKGRGGQPHIRCKVNGEQQMGIPVKPQDIDAIHDKSRLPELAERYFDNVLTEQPNQKQRFHR